MCTTMAHFSTEMVRGRCKHTHTLICIAQFRPGLVEIDRTDTVEQSAVLLTQKNNALGQLFFVLYMFVNSSANQSQANG